MTKTLRLIALAGVALLAFGTAASADSLAVNATCALNGTTNGLQVIKNTATTSPGAFVRSNEPNDESHFIVRFWIDPKSMDIPAPPNDYFQFLRTGHETVGSSIILFLKRNNSNGSYRLTTYARREDNPPTYKFIGESFLVGDGGPAKQVEVEWTAGSPGTVTVKIDGSQAYTNTVTNPNSEVDTVRIGVFEADGAAIPSGDNFYCFDEYESYR